MVPEMLDLNKLMKSELMANPKQVSAYKSGPLPREQHFKAVVQKLKASNLRKLLVKSKPNLPQGQASIAMSVSTKGIRLSRNDPSGETVYTCEFEKEEIRKNGRLNLLAKTEMENAIDSLMAQWDANEVQVRRFEREEDIA